MKHLNVSLVYLGFFALIGSAVYFTNSAYCLWALLIAPAINVKTTESENEQKRDSEPGNI